MSRTNYIFVDFENLPTAELERIASKPVKVMLILGQRHKSLPVKVVKLIKKVAEQVDLVETELNGHNALDFVLACEIGVESGKDPNGYFHILSKDKGFDALVRHLKGKGVHAARHEAFGEILVVMNLAERLKFLPTHLKANHASRPKTRKTLEPYIQAVFGRALSPDEVEETIQGLVSEKIIAISEKGNLTYEI